MNQAGFSGTINEKINSSAITSRLRKAGYDCWATVILEVQERSKPYVVLADTDNIKVVMYADHTLKGIVNGMNIHCHMNNHTARPSAFLELLKANGFTSPASFSSKYAKPFTEVSV